VVALPIELDGLVSQVGQNLQIPQPGFLAYLAERSLLPALTWFDVTFGQPNLRATVGSQPFGAQQYENPRAVILDDDASR
jgi:hypothetical protein